VPVSPEQVERVLSEVAAEVLCRRDFPYFLTWCRIRSDDPLSPGVIPLKPWPFQVERAESWQAGTSEVILKERQLGFSAVLLAPYMLWRAMYHGWTCGYLSKGEDEAREEILRLSNLYEELPHFLKVPGKVRADDATFEGGGRVLAFPSTASAGISYTLQLAVMDEASFHPYAAANFAAIQPAASRGQFIIQSTADPEIGPAGFFHDIYWASKRGDTPYKAVFVARCRPDRDAEWYRKARASFAGQPERFNAYYPETDAEAFVGKTGLVYPMFSESRHVRAEHPWEWAASKRKVAGVDWGGGDPTAIGMYGMNGDQHVHQFGEFYERGPVDVFAMAAFISAWPGPGDVLYDPSQGVAGETLDAALRGTGWRARKADNRRTEGMESVAFLLENDRLSIHAGCTDSIAEFPGYRWRETVDPNSKQRYATHTPVDHHADAHDARRYAVVELTAHLRPMLQLPRMTMKGRPLARSMT
jgi:hypothetical protein